MSLAPDRARAGSLTRTVLTATFVVGVVWLNVVARGWGLEASDLAGYSPFRCWFLSVTGHPCPTCGLTRSVLAAALGRFGEAFHFHPFGPVLLIGAGAALLLSWTNPELLTRARRGFGRPGLKRLTWPAIGLYCVWGFFLR